MWWEWPLERGWPLVGAKWPTEMARASHQKGGGGGEMTGQSGFLAAIPASTVPVFRFLLKREILSRQTIDILIYANIAKKSKPHLNNGSR